MKFQGKILEEHLFTPTNLFLKKQKKSTEDCGGDQKGTGSQFGPKLTATPKVSFVESDSTNFVHRVGTK